jgi:hypothetical protein
VKALKWSKVKIFGYLPAPKWWRRGLPVKRPELSKPLIEYKYE